MALNTQSAALKGRPFKPPRPEGGKVNPRFQAGSLNLGKGFFTSTNLTSEVKRHPAEEYHRNSRVYPQSMIEVTKSTLEAPNNDRYSRLSLPDGDSQGNLHLNYYPIDSARPEYFGNTTTILQKASSYHHPSITPSENSTSSHSLEGQASGIFTNRTPSMFGETFESPPYVPVTGNSSPRDTRTSSQPFHQCYYAGLHDAEALKQEEILVEHPKQYPNLWGDGEQTFRQNYNGALQQQQQTSAWNNGRLWDPKVESQTSFSSNGHQLPNHGSKSPRMRKHHSIPRSNSEGYTYEYGTASSNLNTEGRLKLGRTQSYPPRNAEPISAQHQSTALRFPEDNQQYVDLVNGIRSLGTYENEGNAGYVTGNDDWQREVFNTTSKENPTSSTCSSPVSFDDDTTRRRSSTQLTPSRDMRQKAG
jgi:hypothetical protein